MWYCSRHCQTQDWPSHRLHCRPPTCSRVCDAPAHPSSHQAHVKGHHHSHAHGISGASGSKYSREHELKSVSTHGSIQLQSRQLNMNKNAHVILETHSSNSSVVHVKKQRLNHDGSRGSPIQLD